MIMCSIYNVSMEKREGEMGEKRSKKYKSGEKTGELGAR
jgi:hypothetical protein